MKFFSLDHRYFLVLLLFAVFIFTVWPEIDLWFSLLFYSGSGFFPANEVGFVKSVYYGTPWAGRALFGTAMIIVLIALAAPHQISRRVWRRSAAVVTVVVLGIGLLVHTVLKDGMGRPRPRDVSVFAGPTSFVPTFMPSNFCNTNCSFVSGHACVGFALMSIGMLGVRRRRIFWFQTGIFFGSLIGLVRIAQGGHFLSDIIFAFFAIWGSHLLIRAVWLRFRAWQLERLFSRAQQLSA